ncbi:hypothetical protein [Reinekea sp.]|jgi:hypothetical protein|uniref:hypothetical protein n=1 Tax=Reinekea sp. TaxID=1970455 RepID=UPI002A819682|nr:hypothetical protein [Reinekea sp.]
MARRRYQINATDWFDCLDWLDYQLTLPDWLSRPDHPIHGVGIAGLKDHLMQWRAIEPPHKDLYQSAQLVLNEALQDDDWGRLRKALSAKKRRRREKRLDTQPINITLSAAAHELLLDYKQLSGALTLSDAIEQGLQPGMLELAQRHEQELLAELLERVGHIKASELVKIIENYLKLAVARRSLANSCKIARQLFLKRPDRGTYKLMMERFVEDLVWNNVHLKIHYREFELFTELLDPLKDLKPALETT